MSYIGNAKTPLLLATNVRDDLVPDGVSNTFTLSQEVPGGYEGNVIVVRRRFLSDVIVENTNLVQIAGPDPTSREYTLTITDNYLSAAFSVVQEGAEETKEGDWLSIQYSSGAQSFNSFNKVTSVVYDRDHLTLKLKAYSSNPQPVSYGSVIQKISRKYFGAWEILDAEKQYIIKSEGVYANQKIEIKDFVPSTSDQIYVLHRGEATYNFVPSPASVGPDQLSPNLRNFEVTSQTYTSVPSSFVIDLSTTASNDKSLVVTINGIVTPGASEYLNSTEDPPWTLSQDGSRVALNESLFDGVDASNPLKVRILNLSFSTVSRRHTFAPGQGVAEISDNSVTSLKLSADSVTTSKILDNSVSGNKILLNVGEALRAKKSDGSIEQILSVDASDDTIITGVSSIGINLGTPTQRELTISTSASGNTILPSQNNSWSLGTNSSKLKEIHSTSAKVQALETDSVVAQTVSASGTVTGSNITALANEIVNIKASLEQMKSDLVPVGTILMWSNNSKPNNSVYGGTWIVCDGSSLAKADYAELYAALGGNSLPTWPWGARTATHFTIPDFRKRVPVGNVDVTTFGASENLSSVTDRSLTHSHTGPAHTHNISHKHTIPGHKHVVGTGSELKINSSGAHTTNITHGHSSSSITVGSSGALSHTHDFKHSHGSAAAPLQTSDAGGSHGHTGRTASTTQHRHTAKISKATWPDRAPGYGKGYQDGARSFPFPANSEIIYMDDTKSDDTLLRLESAHTHSLTVDLTDITHKHPFYIAETTNTTDVPKTEITNALNHSHVVSISNTENLTSNGTEDGKHEHVAGDFDSNGWIGPNAAGTPDGNSPIDTTSQDNTASGSANYGTNKTNDVTIPHITLNFIIKAKAN